MSQGNPFQPGVASNRTIYWCVGIVGAFALFCGGGAVLFLAVAARTVVNVAKAQNAAEVKAVETRASQFITVERLPVSQDSRRHTKLAMQIKNDSGIFLNSISLHVAGYDKDGAYLGKVLIGGSNYKPGESRTEEGSLIDVPPGRVSKWRPSISMLTSERGFETSAFDIRWTEKKKEVAP